MAYWHPRIPPAPPHMMTVVSQDTTRVARLAFYMPTFSNLAYLKEVGCKNITCWHFNLKCRQEILLLPTNSNYAKFEKVGIKNANLATLDTTHGAKVKKKSEMDFTMRSVTLPAQAVYYYDYRQ